jgi:hypothetical protein
MKRARKAREPGSIDRIDGIVCGCVLVKQVLLGVVEESKGLVERGESVGPREMRRGCGDGGE